MSQIIVNVKQEPGCEDLPLPQYQTAHSSGMDLLAAVNETITIQPGDVNLISTGMRIAIPEGYEVQVRPRSGLALKHGIGVLNSPGTIDADYRGLLSVILINFGKSPFKIERGDRIAQMVVMKVEKAIWIKTEKLEESDRSSGGFGSTGVE